MKKSFVYIAVVCLLGACSTQDTPKSPVEYVDPFIGTGFHGHTYPGATVPFGAVQLSPDTRRGNWDACSGYHYSDSTMLGFSHTHLSGTGCIDLGDILFHPTTQDITLVPEGDIYKPYAFSHADETATPGYYSVDLKEEGILAELTATTYAGVHRYTFPRDSKASIIIDLAHSLTDETIYELEIEKTADNELVGMRRSLGWVDNQYVYFVAQFSKPFQSVEFVSSGQNVSADSLLKGENLQAIATFNVSDDEPVIVKVGLSIVSAENARENLKHDIPEGFDFDAVRNAATQAWTDALGDIIVEGGTKDELINFYTALYHSKIIPNVVSDRNGEYRRHDMTIGRMPEGEKQYSTFSLWDTFRAWHPLMTLTDTMLVHDMVNSFLNMYDASGELPIWPLSAGETGTMIGYHSVSVIADAYLKGRRGFDAEKALQAMKVSSEKNKKGADYYIKNGFIPSNIKRESISCLLEFAYDDWAIAQMAKAMGHEEDYQTYIERSQNYINVFDGDTKFFRGKRLDGNWETPFNPLEVGRAYTEATAWQYRFFVPQDVNGLIQLFGGKDNFIQALDDLYTVESDVHGDMPDITGLIGQYAHGNEPSHHMAYLYSYVGQPWKTQELTRRLLHEMYKPTPEGIVGNEDCGQMSAWYILSSLGFYPVCPGSNEFVLTSPLFEKATVRLANGNTLVITANDPAKNVYINKVEWNGKEIENNFITYDQLMEGGELRFTLASKPNTTRGTAAGTFPYSYTQEEVVSIPYINKDLDLFIDETEVNLGSATKDAEIRYTLDGQEPSETSALYEKPLKLTETTLIKAKAFKTGMKPSRTMTIQATKANFREPISANPKKNGTSYRYYEGLYHKVADIEKTRMLETGVMREPSIEGAKQEDHFAYIFEGLIYCPEDGVYEFLTRSDDGSVLLIGNRQVVNNDGSHAAIPATGRIALKKGYHPYTLLYFEDYEGEHLSWAWKLPSIKEFAPIPATNLFVK